MNSIPLLLVISFSFFLISFDSLARETVISPQTAPSLKPFQRPLNLQPLGYSIPGAKGATPKHQSLETWATDRLEKGLSSNIAPNITLFEPGILSESLFVAEIQGGSTVREALNTILSRIENKHMGHFIIESRNVRKSLDLELILMIASLDGVPEEVSKEECRSQCKVSMHEESSSSIVNFMNEIGIINHDHYHPHKTIEQRGELLRSLFTFATGEAVTTLDVTNMETALKLIKEYNKNSFKLSSRADAWAKALQKFTSKPTNCEVLL